MVTPRPRRLVAVFAPPAIAVAVASFGGSAQGLDSVLQFANAGKMPRVNVSTVRNGEKVPVGTSTNGAVTVPAGVVAPGTRTAVYRDCDNDVLLVPDGSRVETLSKADCDYERVALFPWNQRAAGPIELNAALAAPALGALQVVVDRDGTPVPDARVTILQDALVVTDRAAGATGTVVLMLPPGRYTATITAGGRTIRGDVAVTQDAMTSFTADTGRGRLAANETPFSQYRPIRTTRADRGYTVSAADLNGLLSVRVDSPIGTTFIAFPATSTLGQTVTWSAITLPSGTTPEQIADRRAQLARQVITINGQRYALADATRWTMAAAPNVSIDVGDTQARVQFPLTFATRPSRAIPQDSSDPIPARAGWPVRIPGMFDGRFDTTTIALGGAGLDVVAESPTGVYFNPPVTPLGVQPVTINEQGQSRQVPIRNIGLDLSVDQDDLWRGQSTPLHVKATGLAGLTSPAFLVLINRTTSIISMSQGNHQFWMIHPRDVAADGQAAYQRAVRGLQRGAFVVDGILMAF